jgi:large subunit ribosomal protein L18
MSRKNNNNKGVQRRRIRWSIRKKINGTAEKPRLTVFKSNRSVYCQLIDDVAGTTIAHVQSRTGEYNKGSRVEQADLVGQAIAEKAKAQNIENVVFDRSGYPYHGIVKAVAEGARKGGLKF